MTGDMSNHFGSSFQPVDVFVRFDIEVEHINAASRAGRHADHGVGPPLPPAADLLWVGRGGFETVGYEWCLGVVTRKH